ncbi:MAG: nucleotidyltransferase domain-containing protein [Cyclobacteriaceae bacterium]|jgi:hypothetical protein
MNLSNEKRKLLDDLVSDLKRIEGIRAVVLGGSHAVGMATENSDLDIGIYYNEQKPFDIEEVKAVARHYADREEPTVTGFYEWGPWVNGGAWITTPQGEVDLLYKNIDQVTKIIANAQDGIWETNYQQQPPYGFSSIIFLAETQACIPLYDPDGLIRDLKESVKQYPEKLQQSVVQQSLWSAEFSIWHAEKFAGKADMYNAAGCFTRALSSIVSALFALNEVYPMGDKRAVEIIEQLANRPANFRGRVEAILCCDRTSLEENVRFLHLLFRDTVELANGKYKPYYTLS